MDLPPFENLEDALGEVALDYQTQLYLMVFNRKAQHEHGEDTRQLDGLISEYQRLVGVLMGILESAASPEYLQLIKIRMNVALLTVDTTGGELPPPPLVH